MFEFEKPNIKVDELNEDSNFGRFIIEPLEKGYGTTLGNSIRRVLLSSLIGSAVSSIKVEGVLHEFSTIPGVKEDVMEIILNLKDLNIIDTTENFETKTAYIDVKGKGEVVAGDIKMPTGIEVANPDLHIATLSGSKDTKLFAELKITSGRGYVLADNNKDDEAPIGTIAIDAIYTPVEKANFMVKNARLGHNIENDQLIIDVWTDGTIKPDEAISRGAKILTEHLNLFVNLSENIQDMQVLQEEEKEEEENEFLNLTIEELDLSVRSYNCLKRASINDVEDLVEKTEKEMMDVRNLGKKSLEEILEKLGQLDLCLRANDE